MKLPKSQPSDSMDFEGCYWRMVTALEPYWFEQSSMSPETAIAKLVTENERLRATTKALVDAVAPIAPNMVLAQPRWDLIRDAWETARDTVRTTASSRTGRSDARS